MSDRAKRERGVARKHGGKARPASGAFWGLKRDVRNPGHYLMEHKDTASATYRFDIRDFVYLEKQCADPLPVFLIEFRNRGSLYVLPGWADSAERKIIKMRYFSTNLDPVLHRGFRLEFTKAGKSVIAVDAEEFKRIRGGLNVEA